LSITVASHELSHGIASLVDRVPLKSTGAFFAHLLMGGFVEPDEEKLNAANNATKLRVFAAGSFTNAVLGILCVFLLFNFAGTIAPFYNVVASGVTIGSVPDNLPAHSSGLQAGDIVTSINGTQITGINDLRRYMADVVPGQGVVVGTARGSFTVKTVVDPNNASHAVMGISGLIDDIVYQPKVPFVSSDFPNILFHAEYWLSIVLVSVALINMLPMYPFDGDKFLETALNVLGIEKTKGIRMVTNGAAYGVLLLNVGLSLYRFGFLKY
jgi:membrane-associated protease RseP (regulator of RpoE activity)